MNATVYIFGELAHGYTQYPDDFTHKIFQQLKDKAKAPTQLAIHREGELMYYGYVRRLEHSKYLGFCVVFNGLMLSDLSPLYPIFENAVSAIVMRGDLLRYDKDGSIITTSGRLREYQEELAIIEDAIMAGFNRLERYVQPLPAMDFGNAKNFVKTFTLSTDQMQDMVSSSYLNAYTLIYKTSGYNTDQMNGYSKVIRELNEENEQLQTEISQLENEINQMKYRQRNYSWVAFLLIIVGVLATVLYYKVLSPDEVTHFETGEFVYYGPLENNEPNGLGVAFYPPDDQYGRKFYIGNFVKGERHDMTGMIIYNDGSFYRGQMTNDNMKQGMYFNVNKSFFIGTYDFNQPSTGSWYQYQATERLVDGKPVKAQNIAPPKALTKAEEESCPEGKEESLEGEEEEGLEGEEEGLEREEEKEKEEIRQSLTQ